MDTPKTPKSLVAAPARVAELKRDAGAWPDWHLSAPQLCDLELLLNGGFSPLSGFMGESDYRACLATHRLADGTYWPSPVVLEISDTIAGSIDRAGVLALRDPEGLPLAVVHVSEIWSMSDAGRHRWMVGGRVEGLQLPQHHDFRSLRLSPAEIRQALRERGWSRALGFVTGGLLHRPRYEWSRRAMVELNAALVVLAAVGTEVPGSLDHFARIRCLMRAMRRYASGTAWLTVVPFGMRRTQRDAELAGVVARNFGCSHVAVFAPSYLPLEGTDPHDATRDRLSAASVVPVVVPRQRYQRESDSFVDEGHAAASDACPVDDAAYERALSSGTSLPDWYTFPDIRAELQRRFPPLHQRGLTVFFTGLSGSGKSTIAKILRIKLLERGVKQVTLLDGDVVRQHLSSGLGFSRQDRETNLRRIAFVASEIVRHDGVAICAPIAPYDAIRQEIRHMASAAGNFLLVFVDAPLDVCEARDPKGLYRKARAGALPSFTGVSDEYEIPHDADLVLRSAETSPEDAATAVLDELQRRGYLAAPES
jgi:sulfate adenylyltransferase